MPRFFVDPQDILAENITITGEDAKHITNVLRCTVGEEITVCDGCGYDYSCRIASLGKEVVLEIQEKTKTKSEPPIAITLYQGLPKGDKLELILQKTVELGVSRIVLVDTKRSVVRLEGKAERKIERWQKIAEAAAKQSGRGMIPKIAPHVYSFAEAVEEAARLDGAIIPYEKEETRGLRQFTRGFSGQSIGVFIGPEGGFDPEEIALAQSFQVSPVTLGKRILRTETAGFVTVAILLYALEEV